MFYQVRSCKLSSLITVTFSLNHFEFLKLSLICLLKLGYLKLNVLFRVFHCSLSHCLTVLIIRLFTSFKGFIFNDVLVKMHSKKLKCHYLKLNWKCQCELIIFFFFFYDFCLCCRSLEVITTQ